MKSLFLLCVHQITDSIIYFAEMKTDYELPLSCSQVSQNILLMRNIKLILNLYLRVLPIQLYILIEKEIVNKNSWNLFSLQ